MRRTSVLLAAVALATAVGTVLTSCSGSDPADAQAQALVAFGGPAGWTASTALQRPTADATTSTVDGVPVTLTAGDQPPGVSVRWTAPPGATAAEQCTQLVAWFEHATREWPSTIDTSTMVATCENDLASATRAAVIGAGAGPAHGAYGRVTYEASTDGGELLATLGFNARA